MKNIPVYLNRSQVSSEGDIDVNTVYKAFEQGLVTPDAVDIDGKPLVKLTRLQAIRSVLLKPEAVA